MSLIGVDLGGTNARAGLIKRAKLVRIVSGRIDSRGSAKDVLNELYGVIDSLISRAVKGIGVGAPSVMDLERGIVYDVQNIPSWKRVPLRNYLEERYGLPIYINNDANCFAVGEKYFGEAKGYSQVVGLIVGTGLGAGVIINGRLYPGPNCGAGEFGMISYRDHNYEHYCSGQFFRNFYRLSGVEVYERARRGDAEARRVFAEFGGHLGEALKAIMYAVDPEIIVLGGSVSRAYRFFREAMWASVKTFAYSSVLRKIRIHPSRVPNIAILGAAALFYDATAVR
ncbi:MAG: ROK family protein [Acidobacteriota bacterium]